MPTAPDFQALDPQCTQRLPYHFAKRHGVISARHLDTAIEVWTRPGISSAIVAEMQRVLGQAVSLRELSSEAFDAALNHAYERGMSQA
ncbi:MAG: hypothetical protein R3268_15135, partial [Acidiferrobacterales bacterium]|nr:hypothetical protein [Acidiferrobacterales bacterium]